MREGTLIVTGGSRGIGAAIATLAAQDWETVIAVSRSGVAPSASPPNVVPVACDITDEQRFRDVLAAVASRHAPIAAVVNNAGSNLSGASAEFSNSDFRQVMELDAVALFGVCREVYPYLAANGGGQIVNIGSFFDRLGVPRQAAYCAAKAAVGAITRCLAVEWARDGIQVLNIAPGYVRTELNEAYLESASGERLIQRMPLRRPADPEDIARIVVSVLDSTSLVLTGETVYVDGAFGVTL